MYVERRFFSFIRHTRILSPKYYKKFLCLDHITMPLKTFVNLLKTVTLLSVALVITFVILKLINVLFERCCSWLHRRHPVRVCSLYSEFLSLGIYHIKTMILLLSLFIKLIENFCVVFCLTIVQAFLLLLLVLLL